MHDAAPWPRQGQAGVSVYSHCIHTLFIHCEYTKVFMQVLPHVQLVDGSGGEDDELRILQLTDMHLFPHGCTGWICSPKGAFDSRHVDFRKEGHPSPMTSDDAVVMVSTLIRRVRPHLVAFTGDIVDGRPFGAEYPAVPPTRTPNGLAFDLFAEAFMRVLAPLHGIPWIFCPGNHDDDGSPWSRNDLLRIFALDGCATPTATCFDHTFTVGFGDEADKSSVRIWNFDSGANRRDIKYEPVSATSVSRYEALSAQLPNVAAELAFVHVPLPEYASAKIVAGTCGLFPARVRAGMLVRPWKWLPQALYMRLGPWLGHDRAVGCSRVNTGLCAALARQGRVCALSCGHNHFNDFVGLHDESLFLCFGRVSGLSPPITWERDGGALPFHPGGRVFGVRTEMHGLHPQDSSRKGKVATWVMTAAEEAAQERITLDPQLYARSKNNGSNHVNGEICTTGTGSRLRIARRPMIATTLAVLGLGVLRVIYLARA